MHLRCDVHLKGEHTKKLIFMTLYTVFFLQSLSREYVCVPKAFSRREHLESSSRTIAHWHGCNSTWLNRRVALSMHPNNVFFLWHHKFFFSEVSSLFALSIRYSVYFFFVHDVKERKKNLKPLQLILKTIFWLFWVLFSRFYSIHFLLCTQDVSAYCWWHFF